MPHPDDSSAHRAGLGRYGLAFALGLFMLLAVVLFLLYWNEPFRPAALLIFLASVLLLAVTAEYARANQQSLQLLREQSRRQNQLGIKFSLRSSQGRARVRVVNIGAPNAIVTKAVVRVPERKPLTLHKHLVVRSGERRGFYLPDAVWGGALQRHLELTLHCESAAQRSTESRAYTLFISSEGRVHKIQKGLRSLWPVMCPNCGQSGFPMRTDGLRDFAAAFARQERMKLHLRDSCPRHDSPLLLRPSPAPSPFGPQQEVPAEWQDTPPASPPPARRAS